MFAPTRYLQWTRRFHGTTRFDLATSGMTTVPLAELGMPLPEHLDDCSGPKRLREAIAAYNGVREEEVVAALGTTHAIWLACVALASPGDEVLIEEPAYEPLIRIAEGVGAHVVRFAREKSERFALDPDRVARAMTARTRIVAVTNLHNPSGARASDETLRAVARVAEERGACLLVDEVYAPFDDFVDERGIFHGSARRLAPNVVAVSSLTKCYGLGPQCIGWLLGPSEVVARAEDAMTACYGGLPILHAHVALHAFTRIGHLAQRARVSLVGKRDRVAAWVASHESIGLEWSAPTDGLFALVMMPSADDAAPEVESTAREHDVLIVPGALFGAQNAFRLAWSAPAAALEDGLARLGGILTARFQPGR